ncbi:hypothetical protein NUSPORA_02366 [Nucleospora cyclopteri]
MSYFKLVISLFLAALLSVPSFFCINVIAISLTSFFLHSSSRPLLKSKEMLSYVSLSTIIWIYACIFRGIKKTNGIISTLNLKI